MITEQADEDLMVLYQKGEVRAFEVLLSRHRKPVYNFIYRFVGDKETAEDLLQEAFMRVIKGAEAYKRQAKFTTWLYTIARNLCVDQTRRRKHRKHASLDAPMGSDEESGTLLDVLPGNEMASDRKSVNKQLHEQMQKAIASLSDEQREVFLMREFLDMPFKQIADVVGVPENTVKSRMRYALEKLRLELDEYKESRKGRAVMAEQDDDEFELGDLRSVFSSMREAEEDPPETGMAALMAAARMKATEMKPPRSLWERIFGVMRTPPVLAFATVVVLVGGGAVMFRHRAEMKETVHVAAPSSGRAVPARETVRSDEPPQEQTAPVELAVPEAELGTAPPMAPSGRRRVLTRKQTKALNDEIDRVAKDAMLDIDVDSLAGKKTSGGELDAMAPSNGPGIGGPPLPKVSTTTLVTRWESAAVAKNCALANSLGAQLAERDQALYMRTFQKNQSLQDCFNSKP